MHAIHADPKGADRAVETGMTASVAKRDQRIRSSQAPHPLKVNKVDAMRPVVAHDLALSLFDGVAI